MNVGYTMEVRRSPHHPQSWAELFGDCLWIYEEAEKLGFDSLLVQEHFFTPDGYGPSMPVLLATLIERTSNARLGSHISIAPLHHPAQLAQEMAVLDQLSGGRIDVGIGAGHRVAEYRAMGINPRTRPSRMEEAVEIMKLAWTGEPFSYEGKYHQLENVQVSPEPAQSPHPPLWMAATAAPPAERAGRFGLDLAAGSLEPEVFDSYRASLERNGFDLADRRISMARSVTVTDEDPEAIWQRNQDHYFFRWDFYRQIRAEIGDAELAVSTVPSPEVYRANELIGDADTVLAELKQIVELGGLTDLIIFGPAPGIDLRGEGIESLRRFADEVLPVLKSW